MNYIGKALMESYSQRLLQAHCHSPTSPSTDQSYVKELAKPTQEKLFFLKIPQPFKKIKNATHNPTQIDKKVNIQ